jgi:hypothetical protein
MFPHRALAHPCFLCPLSSRFRADGRENKKVLHLYGYCVLLNPDHRSQRENIRMKRKGWIIAVLVFILNKASTSLSTGNSHVSQLR